MDRSLKRRTIFLAISFLLIAGALAPTFFSDSLPPWFPFKKKIILGLDLQGGSHYVYRIDLEKAVSDKADKIRSNLEAKFKEDNIAATVRSQSNGAITVTPADPAKRDEIKTIIQSEAADTIDAPQDCQDAAGKPAICFGVSQSYAEKTRKGALTNAVSIIRERIDVMGVAEPTVVEKGDQIIVELPGLDEEAKKQTREIIARSAKLEFKVVADGSDFMQRIKNHVGIVGKKDLPTDPKAQQEGIQMGYDRWSNENGPQKVHQDWYLKAYDKEDDTLSLEGMTDEQAQKTCAKAGQKLNKDRHKCIIEGRAVLQRYLDALAKEKPELKVPEGYQIRYELVEPRDATDTRSYWRSYLLDVGATPEGLIRLTGESISNAGGSYDPQTNHPVVLLDFDRYGSRVFGDLTSRIVGKKLATVLDETVKSAPQIIGPIRGGRASITMGGGDPHRQEMERDKLVNVLKTGSLAAPLQEDSVSDVGPTLGRDAIAKTRLSFIIGVILVIVIMVGIYKWSGWVAVFAVMFHIVVTLAVMALFGATLTLPGIAALVLSVGMCVDGNILINERIRDELLLGKSVRGAIDLGFSRAFSAILDGQLTIAASAWVLLQYGSGPIKGFAVMMLVGVFTTIATNTWVTRILFDWGTARKKTATTLSI
jgi:preprotein translocase subunit SecD